MFFAGCAILLCNALVAYGADGVGHAPDPALIKLTLTRFHSLTRAERAMLTFADAGNVERGEIAVAGSSADPADPSNDPRHADEWPHERDIRASLIKWLCEDPEVTPLINRAGIKILGARIVGGLNLSHVRVPFALEMRNCSIAQRIILKGTEIPHLDLNGSYVSEIDAIALIVHGDLDLADGFHASERLESKTPGSTAPSIATVATFTIRRSLSRSTGELTSPP